MINKSGPDAPGAGNVVGGGEKNAGEKNSAPETSVWGQPLIDAAFKSLAAIDRADPQMIERKIEILRDLREKLEAIKKYEENSSYSPRELPAIVSKINYKESAVLKGHGYSVNCLQALPDGRIVSGREDSTLRIWQRDSSGQWQSEVLEWHGTEVLCLQALPDGRIVSGSRDCTLRIWQRDSSGQWQSEVLKGHGNSVRCLQALPDGRIVSGSDDDTLRIWDGEKPSFMAPSFMDHAKKFLGSLFRGSSAK
jgi:WD40 repeat protein